MATIAQKKYWKSMKGKSHGHRTNNGNPAWNRGKKNPDMTGNKHFAWKGDAVSYSALHAWIRRVLGKAVCCQICKMTEIPDGKKRYFDWANLSGKYLRKVEDWKQMCKKCHREYDASHSRAKSFSDLPL